MMTRFESYHLSLGHEVKHFARAEIVNIMGKANNCGGTVWLQCSCGIKFDERPISFTQWKKPHD